MQRTPDAQRRPACPRLAWRQAGAARGAPFRRLQEVHATTQIAVLQNESEKYLMASKGSVCTRKMGACCRSEYAG